MTKYAYRDKNRRNIIYSNQVIKEDRNTAFFCPNPMCNAKLFICSIDGSEGAYFRATKPEFRHIPNCPFENSGAKFNENKLNESKFDYDNAIDNLLCPASVSSTAYDLSNHGWGKSGNHPPRTLRQIYSICKSLPVEALYAGKEIGEMILDDRSEYRYPKGCFGNKIIEATAGKRIYDSKKKEIYLVSPINSKKYSFVLSFLDESIYKTIRSEIYNNRDKVIVVVGRWESSGEYNKFISKVHGKKQVVIIKR